MEWSVGMIMMGTGAAGFLVCLILLLILPGHFRKQRERLLERMDRE